MVQKIAFFIKEDILTPLFNHYILGPIVVLSLAFCVIYVICYFFKIFENLFPNDSNLKRRDDRWFFW